MSAKMIKCKENNRGLFLLFSLAIVLVLVKVFFVRSYYIRGDGGTLPQNVSTNSLLIVSIHSTPKSAGDLLLIEAPNGDFLPTQYLGQRSTQYLVDAGAGAFCVDQQYVRGKIIYIIRL